MEYHTNIKFINIKQITKNKYNSNIMSDGTFEALKNNIAENGFVGAILVRKHPLKNNMFEIIDGEKRYSVLKELGEEKVPCIILDYNDINTTINMIRFNREHGYFDKNKTKTVVDDLIKKTNKLFVREVLHTGLKEFDALIDGKNKVFSENDETSRYTNILQESEKSKKLFL